MVHIFNVWTIIMHSLNEKEWKLLELQIAQTRPPLILFGLQLHKLKAPPMDFRWKKCLSLTSVKNKTFLTNLHKKEVHIFNV